MTQTLPPRRARRTRRGIAIAIKIRIKIKITIKIKIRNRDQAQISSFQFQISKGKSTAVCGALGSRGSALAFFYTAGAEPRVPRGPVSRIDKAFPFFHHSSIPTFQHSSIPTFQHSQTKKRLALAKRFCLFPRTRRGRIPFAFGLHCRVDLRPDDVNHHHGGEQDAPAFAGGGQFGNGCPD